MRYVSVKEAGRLLREGKVGLVPTETVVGLVVGEDGLSRLYQIKARDPVKPVALLCADAEKAFALARAVPPLARLLAEHFWPGPLTLVLDAIGAGAVGVRVPAHPVARAVLVEYEGSVMYATSANPSGEPAPRALEDVTPSVWTAVDFAVEGEPGSGEASAVVDLSGGQVRLLRSAESLDQTELSRLVNSM